MKQTTPAALLMGWVVLLRAASDDSAKASHWAFQPVKAPAPPAVVDHTWPRSPVDNFVLSRLEAHGVRPAPRAGRRTLIRRATFDLTGLPPSPDEVDAFLSDSRPDAFPRLVERLLESPRYGEQWGRHWLDVVRYADTAGETADYPTPTAWRYRNYVIEAFNKDKPYDEFLREQIAGDILARTGPRDRYAERVTATGYLALSRRFGFDSENYQHLTIQDTIDTLGQSLLGVTLGCARCHAHKFDPVTMQDYYALYGIFEGTRYAFPGSEQKQKTRALLPLSPPEEAQPRWLEYEGRVAALSAKLERRKAPIPSGVLRSLDDIDGDFELQAPAAGGSKGVLVPPWVYQGDVSITSDAQSPFKHLHPLGKVGASIPDGAKSYRITQQTHLSPAAKSSSPMYVNLDFRLGTNTPGAGGVHRFWLGTEREGPAFEILLGVDGVRLRAGDRSELVDGSGGGAWRNLQLVLDLTNGTVSGCVGTPGAVRSFPARPLSPTWGAGVDFVSFGGASEAGGRLPALALDNLGIQQTNLRPVSTEPPPPDPTLTQTAQAAALLRDLTEMDGDFELQTEGELLQAPWGPGPGGQVKISSAAQSPFHNLHPPGRLGISLPSGEAYNGFGQTLSKNWAAGYTDHLYAAFDFRISTGESGSWRYYLGHGPGSSAAVELFCNGEAIFKREGAAVLAVAPLRPGCWNQVQLDLDLRARTYTARVAAGSARAEFSGLLTAGWDGTIDYTFIDSYGHRRGGRPPFDADNFTLTDRPLPGFEAEVPAGREADRTERRAKVQSLRRALSRAESETEADRRSLERLIAAGPVELTYGVSEGTPRNARVQQRGEPDRQAEEVPRGFPRALGGRPIPAHTRGSGRLELAEWLTSPANPLTARVMVNRIWLGHFGEGLVKTPNDFGTRGQPPTHPELLDYLADRFIRSGWSVKAMHRLIMLSAAYQQESRWSSPGEGEDAPPPLPQCPVAPEVGQPPKAQGAVISEELSPFPRRRLSAEETRDAILFVSGRLDFTPRREHPFPAPTGWGFTQHAPFGAVYDHDGRSVYLMTQRIKRHPFLALFDGPDPNATTPARRTTTVPTQALFFLNDPFVHECAGRLAARIRVESRTTRDEDQIGTEYRLVLGRNPSVDEGREAADFLERYRGELRASAPGGAADVDLSALAAFARVLFGGNEFLTVD